MCKRNGEFVDHLFLHFDVALAIWIAFFSHFGLSWVMSRSVVNMNACWWTFVSLQSAVMWRMVPMCFLWCLWREMNHIICEDLERFFFFKDFFF
jgi:hypothetical protein